MAQARLISLTLLVAATLVHGAGRALATQAFLCEDGRVVYVKFGELEQLKRTDPCIARYFGLTAGTPAKAAAAPATLVPSKPPAPAPATHPAAPIASTAPESGTATAAPVKAPAPQASTVPAYPAPPMRPAAKPALRGPAEETATAIPVTDWRTVIAVSAENKPMTAPRAFDRNARLNPGSDASPISAAGKQGSVASSGTNYRNVRIINAEPGATPWYRHTR
jgi:hypothetical protein